MHRAVFLRILPVISATSYLLRPLHSFSAPTRDIDLNATPLPSPFDLNATPTSTPTRQPAVHVTPNSLQQLRHDRAIQASTSRARQSTHDLFHVQPLGPQPVDPPLATTDNACAPQPLDATTTTNGTSAPVQHGPRTRNRLRMRAARAVLRDPSDVARQDIFDANIAAGHVPWHAAYRTDHDTTLLFVPPNTLGDTITCIKCGAWLFHGEKTGGTVTEPTSGLCCGKGKIQLPCLDSPPEPLVSLLHGGDPRSKAFRDQLRAYNSALQMASSAVKLDNRFTSGIHQFRISGGIHHLMGSLLPEPGETPAFGQLFIIDEEEQLRLRSNLFAGLDPVILRELQSMLMQHNPYVQFFRQAAESSRDAPNVLIRMRGDNTPDPRRYNLPAASEVAGLIPDSDTLNKGPRDIVLRMRGGGVQRLSDLNRAYDPLHFVLMHPRGEPGWGPYDNHQVHPVTLLPTSRHVTAREHAAFRLQRRDFEPPTMLQCARLTQEYMVDQYCKVETDRLRFLERNQAKLRAELYQGLQDSISRGDGDARSVGLRVVLPSSFLGGPRNMHQTYLDAMAIVRKHGKPDLFITMTCNPNWDEVRAMLLPGQSANDRPDVLSRVFRLKLESLVDRLVNDQVLGRTVARVWVVEFQKRGLPHAHMLLVLAPESKLRSPTDVDRVVCAEIPDPEAEPVLHNIVTSTMMHGPCGSLCPPGRTCTCMEDGICTKNYPRDFCNETIISNDGYPLYRRRDQGRTVTVGGVQLDNRWVVPYNRGLSKEFGCHINVEHCSTVKYVYMLACFVFECFHA